MMYKTMPITQIKQLQEGCRVVSREGLFSCQYTGIIIHVDAAQLSYNIKFDNAIINNAYVLNEWFSKLSFLLIVE